MVNWTWQQIGGAWTYIKNLTSLYKQHGHEVIPFSMKSPGNEETEEFENYFIGHIDYKELNKKKVCSKA
jgi:hypothetical protein